MRRFLTILALCLTTVTLCAQQTKKLTLRVSPKPICDFSIYVDNPETNQRVLQFDDSSVRYVGQPLDIPVGYKVRIVTRDMDYFLYYNNWTLKEVVGNVVFTGYDSWSSSWQQEFVMPADDLTLTYVFEFNPQNPQNPSTNGWYSETGQVVIDNPSTNGLGNDMANVCNFPDNDWYDQVHGITVIGALSRASYLGTWGIKSYLTALERFDFSRTTGISELNNGQVYQSPLNNVESLRELLLPATITRLGEKVFEGTYLQSLTLYSATPPEVASKTRWVEGVEETYQTVFPEDGVPQVVFVPEESLPLYKNAFFWKDCNLQPIVKNARKLTVNILPGTPTAEQIRPYVGMTLRVRDTKSGGTRSMLITSHSNYVFRTLPANAYYDVQLVSKSGSVAGELKNVYLDEDQTVTLPALRQTATVLLTSGYDMDVTWLNSRGDYLTHYVYTQADHTPMYLTGVLEGDEVQACLKFQDKSQSMTFKMRDTVRVVVKAGENTVSYQRQALPQHALMGRAYDNVTNSMILRPSVMVNYVSDGACIPVAIDINRNNGLFNCWTPEGDYEVTVAADGYRTARQTLRLNENRAITPQDNGNALVFMLTPAQGSTILLTVGQERFYNGYATTAASSYPDIADMVYSVRNLTTDEDITDFALIGTNVRLNDTLSVGTRIRITVSSRTGNFAPETVEGTWSEKGLELAMMLKQNGALRAEYGETACAFAGALLFGSDGNIVARQNYGMGRVTFADLPEDDYTLVSLDAQSNWYKAVSSLAQLKSLLTKDVDYAESMVNASRLRLSEVQVPVIPKVRESVQMYTIAEECSARPSKPSLITGNYQTYRVKMALRPEYRDKATDIELLIDGLDNSLRFVEGSVMVGSNISSYTFQSGRLVIPMTQANQPVRFCVVGTKAGTYTPTAQLSFMLDGRTVMQPLAVEGFVAEASTIAAPTAIAMPVLTVSGVTAPQADIVLEDRQSNGGYSKTVATTKADMQGSWSCRIELENPVALSRHTFVASITTKEGVRFDSEQKTVVYDPNTVRPKTVTMSHFNSYYRREMKMVFDYETGTRTPDSYYFYQTAEFTFVVDLTDNDPKKVQAVELNVFTSDNDYTTLQCAYDEQLGKWTAHDEFSSGRLPVNVNVEVAAETPVEVDNRAWDSVITYYDNVNQAQRDYTNQLTQQTDAIKQQTAAAGFEVTDEGIKDIIRQYQDMMKDLDLGDLSDAKGIYGSAFDPENPDPECPWLPGFRPNPKYDGADGMDLWIADAEAMIADIEKDFNEQQLKEMVDAINNASTMQNLGSSIPGMTITSATGLTALGLLNDGYETTALTGGRTVYSKVTDSNYIVVDLQNNVKVELQGTTAASLVRMNDIADDAGEFLGPYNKILNKLEDLLKQALESTNKLIGWAENICKECMAAEAKYQISQKEFVKHLAELPGKMWQNSTRVKPLVNRITTKMADIVAHCNCLKWTQEKLKKLFEGSKWLAPKVKDLIGATFKIIDVWDGIKQGMELLGELYALWEILPSPCEKHPYRAAFLKGMLIEILVEYGGALTAKAGVDVVAFCTAVTGIVGITTIFAAPVGAAALGATIGVELGVSFGMSALGWWNKQKINGVRSGIESIRHDCELSCEEKKTCCKKADGTPCCKNGDCKKHPKPDPDFKPDGKPIMDPSGYVYEAVPSNKVVGAKATVYYKEATEDMFGEVHVTPVVWDAENYAQENPLFTDENGEYAWDVPQGQWQVVFEKEGYETTRTEWLPVPPPQLDINIGMKQFAEPVVEKVKAYEQEVQLTFSKYMKPGTLTAEHISLMRGEEMLPATIELMDSEADTQGDSAVYASRVRLVPATPLVEGQQVTLVVSGSVESYAGIQMAADYSQAFGVEKHIETLAADSAYVVRQGQQRTITVKALPAAAAAGKTLQVQSVNTDIARLTTATLTLNAQGQADITVGAVAPGTTALRLKMEDEDDLERYIIINVRDSAGVYTKAPEASQPTGAQLYKGDRIYLTTETPDAKIWYSLNGTCPCEMTQGHVFAYDPAQGVKITADTLLLKAYAIANDYEESNVATFRYTLARTQTAYNLKKGWTWISNNTADELSTSQLTTNAESYVLDAENLASVQTMQPAVAYKAYMSVPATVTISAAAFKSTENSIALQSGWNWLPYTVAHPLTVSEAMSTITPDEGDLLVGQDGFAEYSEGQWIGSLPELIPGRAYRYKAVEQKELVLNTHTSPSTLHPSPSTTWNVQTQSLPDVMPLTAVLRDAGIELGGDEYALGAFRTEDNTCLGEAQLVDGCRLIAIGGEQGLPVRFVAYHKLSQKYFTVQETLVFDADKQAGSRKEPVVLTLGEEADAIGGLIVNPADTSGSVFSLEGVKMDSDQQLRKGVYVRQGQKVVVK